jgi:hypothetical protein
VQPADRWSIRHSFHFAGTLVTVLSLLLMLFAASFLARLLYYEFFFIDGDAYLFWTVGRGIVNGLLPYQDLFETKPPGVFILSALSFILTDSPMLMHVLNSLSFLAIGATPLAFLIISKKMRPADILKDRSATLKSTFILSFSVVLAYYTSRKGGDLFAESYGIFFCCVYIMLWASGQGKKSIPWTHTVFAGILILAIIGTKEPFLLTVIAVSLILSRSKEHLLKLLIVPLCISLVLGLMLLLILGLAGPFFTIYLPYMLNQRLYIDSHTPVLLRGLEPFAVFDLFYFSPLMLILLFILLVHFLLSQITRSRANAALQSLRTASIAYFTFLAVGIGGNYFRQHYTIAVPSYLALLAAFAISDHKKLKHAQETFLVIGAVFSLVILISFDFGSYREIKAHTEFRERENIEPAKYLDRLMDASNRTRYLFIGANMPVAICGYSKHSPLGPIFNQEHDWIDLPIFERPFLSNFDQTDIVVVNRYSESVSKYSREIELILQEDFTREPWENLRGIPAPTSTTYSFYFRKELSD